MTPPPDPKTPGFFERFSPRAQWAVLIACSCLMAAVLEVAGLPAALLLGPMIAGILLGSNGGTIRAPRLPVLAAQTIVGCLVARAITGDIVVAFLKDWPLLVGVVLIIIATSGLLGWTMARFKVLPGTTAIWGTAPGAASAMMVLAGAFGADARLVAFMQYLRVVIVAALASAGRALVGWRLGGSDASCRVVSRGSLAGFHGDPRACRSERRHRRRIAHSRRCPALADDRWSRAGSDGAGDDRPPAVAAGAELRVSGLEHRLGVHAGNSRARLPRPAAGSARDFRR